MRRTAYLVSFENIRLSLDFSFLLASCSLLAGTVSILPSHPGNTFILPSLGLARYTRMQPLDGANVYKRFGRLFTGVLRE